MMMTVLGQFACLGKLSELHVHDSTLLEFSTVMKCFTDDSNNEVVIFKIARS